MKTFKINPRVKNVIRVITTYLFILLAIIFTIIVFIACYLLIADFFYDKNLNEVLGIDRTGAST